LKRYRQTVDELLDALSAIQASWRDKHSEAVIRLIDSIPDRRRYSAGDIGTILDRDFAAGLTAIRLILDRSKHEFAAELQAKLGSGGAGVTRYRQDAERFVSALVALGTLDCLGQVANAPVTWRGVLIERLKAGRGSAIKGQARGRFLEDFTEQIVRDVFGEAYDARCRFVGAGGTSTEKTDFAIPSKQDARILIEVKAYGATGSKQTDILGDIRRIVEEKRHDTHLLLVTDGTTWKARVNDLRKLVEMQNKGLIARIYTHNMKEALRHDLRQLRRDHGL
jgi:DpnII restriction endonuclease